MAQRFIARIVPAQRPDTVCPDYAGRDDTCRSVFKARLSEIDGMTMIKDREDLTVAAQGCGLRACGDHGIILGTLFRHGEQHRVGDLSLAERDAIIAGKGQHLIEAFWGPYIAFLDHPSCGLSVLRAPWGDLPCYSYRRDDVIFLASDIELLTRCAAYQPMVAWPEVIEHLVHGPYQHKTTCLAGIGQLPGGERWTFGKDQHEDITQTLWSPWAFAAHERQITDADAASALIRQTTLDCIGARASQFEDLLVTLSGGLDSSIVAASLARQQASVSAMTLVTRDAIGDEHDHAARVSDMLGMALTSCLRDVSKVDVSRSGAKGRPFPCVHGFFMESMRLADKAATTQGAQAIFNGGGGDSLFCSMQSGAPAADRLLAEGPGRGFLRSLDDMSRLAPASIPAVLRDAVARAWLGKPAFRLRPHFELLTERGKSLASTRLDHPWLSIPSGMPPGKALHVWLLADFKAYVENLDPQSTVPIVAPLLSQPLVEACLSVPSWMWFERGLNRMVARRAFAGLLPPETLSRRSKGTPGSFIFEIFETHCGAIRAMLVQGQLARQELIDLPGVLRILDDPRPPGHDSLERILDFLDVEAWATSWVSD